MARRGVEIATFVQRDKQREMLDTQPTLDVITTIVGHHPDPDKPLVKDNNPRLSRLQKKRLVSASERQLV
jgi:hypothetical protein